MAGDFVAALFGDEWLAMTPIVRMFCLAGLLESIGNLDHMRYSHVRIPTDSSL